MLVWAFSFEACGHPLVAPSWDLGAPAPGVHGYFFLALVKMTIGICRHARFYLDHKCEINSKRLDPPRSPQGYSLPKRTPGGGPAPWILSHSNFRSGTLILSLEGWAHRILFSSYLRFGTYLLFSDVIPFNLGPTCTFDWKGRKKTSLIWVWGGQAPLENSHWGLLFQGLDPP